MYRSMMQAYVKGSDKAVAFYQKVFDAKLGSNYPNPDGTYLHAELDVYGQILALGESDGSVTGNTMQFCLHFGDGTETVVQAIIDGLKEGAKVFTLLDVDWSPLAADITDQFGVRWCIFV